VDIRKRKAILGLFEPGSRHWVGDGFPVRNMFPSNGVDARLNPFLMLDYAGPAEFAPSRNVRGVDEHPHRGFETVTIAYQGAVEHRDSAGNSGIIRPGDVQWMTAAAGVVHEEKHEREFSTRGGTFELVQLWVNLPMAYKMSQPRYQAISSTDIPVVEIGPGASARIIAGELHGVRGAARTFTPVNIFDLKMAAGSRGDLPLPDGHNSAIALLRGSVLVNDTRIDGEALLALLSPEGDAVSFHAGADSLLLILTGEPIDEPIASYGPFVMNTREEVLQAIDDYRAGRMGRLTERTQAH
jgi:redox-sensitive bicupin YhaK (pirin superfamily)